MGLRCKKCGKKIIYLHEIEECDKCKEERLNTIPSAASFEKEDEEEIEEEYE